MLRALMVAGCIVPFSARLRRSRRLSDQAGDAGSADRAGGVIDRLCRILARRFSEAWKTPGRGRASAGCQQSDRRRIHHQGAAGRLHHAGQPGGDVCGQPSLYKRLHYDPFKGFTPIAGLVIINHALILHPSVPVGEREGPDWLAKEKPGALNYGTFGSGSSGHLNMVMLQTMSGASSLPSITKAQRRR